MKETIDKTTGEILEKPKYRNSDNFKLGQSEKDFEENNEPSMTVPDESFTIKEILEKYTRGIAPNIFRTPSYAPDEVDFDDMTITDGNDFDVTDVEAEYSVVNQRIEASKSKSEKPKKGEQSSVADAGAEIEV